MVDISKLFAISKIDRDDGYYGPLKVCMSNAGYYIGREFHYYAGYTEPGNRESNYFGSKKAAQHALETKTFKYRDCEENTYLYGCNI